MTKYSNGANYERKLKQLLLSKGATLVIRSAGSKGLIDLVAFYYNKVELYQIKTTSQKTAYFKAEIEELKRFNIENIINSYKYLAIYWKKNKNRGKQGWEFIWIQ